MRRRFQELLTEEMAKNEDIFLLVGDVGYRVFDHLREDYPDRVINPGAAEQLMIGMGVGLAMEGKIPVCYSITPFVLYRPFEFIRNYLHHEQIGLKEKYENVLNVVCQVIEALNKEEFKLLDQISDIFTVKGCVNTLFIQLYTIKNMFFTSDL